MACIIKFPNNVSKGVISITNIELKILKKKLYILEKIKENWILLYHPNYYDYNFYNKNIFVSRLSRESWNQNKKSKNI